MISALLTTGHSLSEETRRFAHEVLAADVNRNDVDAPVAARTNYGHRELQTLQLLSDGLSNKQIAFRLGISDSTVKFHRKNLYRKLNAHNRAAALEQAKKLALL